MWEAERVRDSCRSAASDAAAALAAVERARSDLTEAIRLRAEVQRLEARAAHTASMALFAERRLRDARRQRTRLANDWRSDRFGNRNERSRLGGLMSRRQAEFGAAVTAAAEADRLLCQHRARVEPLIAVHERAATSVTVEEIARRDAAAGQAWSALAEANRACRAVAEEADRCEAALWPRRPDSQVRPMRTGKRSRTRNAQAVRRLSVSGSAWWSSSPHCSPAAGNWNGATSDCSPIRRDIHRRKPADRPTN